MRIQCKVTAQDFTKVCIKKGEREKWVSREQVNNWDEIVFIKLRDISQVDLTDEGFREFNMIKIKRRRKLAYFTKALFLEFLSVYLLVYS